MTWPGRNIDPEQRRIVELYMAAMRDPVLHRNLKPRTGKAHPLYGWQADIVNFAEEKIEQCNGETVTIRITRQAGKNECAGQIHERHLLRRSGRGGNIVRTAPTHKPQIVNSKARLEKLALNDPLFDYDKLRWREGYVATYGRATVTFMSASESSHQEGATADVCLDVDEAHLTSPMVMHERLSPMTASTNACTLLWGVAANKTDLLFLAREKNFEHGLYDNNIQITAERLSEINPVYAEHFEMKKKQLGEDHPVIMTQYRLIDLDAESGFFKASHQSLILSGDHERSRLQRRRAGVKYAVVIDLAGEDEFNPDDLEGDAPDSGSPVPPDQAVAMVCELDYSMQRQGKPLVRIVEVNSWTGLKIQSVQNDKERSLQEELMAVLGRWNPEVTLIDARGVGISTASWLDRLWPRQVVKYAATSVSVTEDSHMTWAYINTGQLRMHKNDSSPEYVEMVRELGWARAEYGGSGNHSRINMKKPSSKHKIDIVKCLTYIPRAIEEIDGGLVQGIRGMGRL